MAVIMILCYASNVMPQFNIRSGSIIKMAGHKASQIVQRNTGATPIFFTHFCPENKGLDNLVEMMASLPNSYETLYLQKENEIP